ncbi:hypothetical protein L3X38_025471 [Prunus dulcis]|uniref:Basic helix-loop-helix DNA-binding superfamily protein n=1 Tax=Prunus dulcis TaxID=3755 RepID=A0AAD4W2Y1_PRUDU|nr:hypothetical protein L3X38_025471 [Prunus dulcis]
MRPFGSAHTGLHQIQIGFFHSSFFPLLPPISFHTQPAASHQPPIPNLSLNQHVTVTPLSAAALLLASHSRCSKSEIPFARSVHLFISYSSLSLSLSQTDKASMLDEIIDYVKFLQLQVKVLSMSRLGGAAAVAPLVADVSSEYIKVLLLSYVLIKLLRQITTREYVRAEYVFGASAHWFWLLGILLWHIEQVAEKEGSFGFTKLTLKL